MTFHLKRFPYVLSTLAVPCGLRSPLRSSWRPGLVLLLVFCGAGLPAAAQTKNTQSSGNLPVLELLERAHTQFSQGDYNAARRNYLKVLPSFPDNFDILRDLGTCYFATGPRGYAQAAKYYLRAYHINPRSAEVANRLFECYMALKKYREAAEVEMKLARLPHAPAEGLKRAAEAYAAAGDHAEARQAYLSYLQRKPGDLLARCQLGRLEELNKNYSQAAGQYRIVLSSNPDFIPALVGMARLDSGRDILTRAWNSMTTSCNSSLTTAKLSPAKRSHCFGRSVTGRRIRYLRDCTDAIPRMPRFPEVLLNPSMTSRRKHLLRHGGTARFRN